MWEKIPGPLPLFHIASNGKLGGGLETRLRLYIHGKWVQASKQANLTHAHAWSSHVSVELAQAHPIMQCDYANILTVNLDSCIKHFTKPQNYQKWGTNICTGMGACFGWYSKWNIKIKWYKPMHSKQCRGSLNIRPLTVTVLFSVVQQWQYVLYAGGINVGYRTSSTVMFSFWSFSSFSMYWLPSSPCQ